MNIYTGIDDFTVALISSIVLKPIKIALMLIPYLVMFQNLTPKGVEATMMAINSSVTNLCSSFLPNISGVIINNSLVHVTKSNLNNLEYLI